MDVPWPFTSVDIFLTQIQCRNVYIEDMILSPTVVSNTEIDVVVKIVDLGMTCTFNWRYDFGFRGNGNAYIVSRGNDVNTRIGFYSEDFNHHAPSSSQVEHCSSDINVNDIHFNGGISGTYCSIAKESHSNESRLLEHQRSNTGTILNLFKSKVKDMIEDEVTDMVCGNVRNGIRDVVSILG